MPEPEFDARLIDWLRDGPSASSDWVLEAVLNHARRHPRRPSLRTRWSDAMRAVAVRHPATPAIRLALILVAVTGSVALAGVLLVGSRGLVGGPTPTPTPTPSPTLAVIASERYTDPAGDAPEGQPDIIAITTAVTADRDLVLSVEAAGSWPTDGNVFRAWLVVDDQLTRGAVGYLPACNPWLTDFSISVGPGYPLLVIGDAGRYGLPGWQTVEYSVAGPLLTVVVPLAALGDPERLGIGVTAGDGDEPDMSPDDGASCHPVPLAPAGTGPAATPAQTPSGADPAAIIVAEYVTFWMQ